jgi:hypothetical protein
MKRRTYLGSLGAAAAGGVTGCVSAPSTPASEGFQNPSFEDGLAGWTVGTDLPTDPNTGQPVATEASVTDEPVSDGDSALALFIDGRQDDGTIWVQQPVDLSTVAELAVDIYSEQESFNTITKLAVYAGPDPGRGLTEGDFDTRRPTEDHEGWKTQTYPVAPVMDGLVAVGISVVWETEVTRILDNVVLR